MKSVLINYKWVFILLSVMFMNLNCVQLHKEIKNSEEKLILANKNQKVKTYSDIAEFITATGTIFVSGIGDKSFFITAVMATKYSKLFVFISAVSSLTLMGYISVQMGLTLPNYVSSYWIDITAVIIFIVIGLKMIIDGSKMNDKNEKDKLEEVSREIDKEILKDKDNESVTLTDYIIKDSNNDEKNNTNSNMEAVKIFGQTFVLVFLSELGDKSQISTIYLSANSNPNIIFCAVVLAQILLTVIAIIGGKLIAERISEKTLNIIAGAMFLAFGVISLYITYINDYVIINKAWEKFLQNEYAGGVQKMPKKVEIYKNFK